ncbi:hypothetical protein ABH906_005247 [Pseudomonas frederiksbergensis]
MQGEPLILTLVLMLFISSIGAAWSLICLFSN